MTANNPFLNSVSSRSWNTHYLTPEGFECQLTLRGETGQMSWKGLVVLWSTFRRQVASPCSPKLTQSAGNNGNQSQSNGNGISNNGNDRSWCPIHECQMKRWEKDGRSWFSHKVGTQWCTGKEKTR
jgi:hypothetical protein